MSLKFIDLFAGIGGFHQAVKSVFSNSKCIAAVEFDESASNVYNDTYGIKPLGDITNEDVLAELDEIVKNENGFDLLFAGFPCQTFSQAGKREGFNDEIRGTLFFSIDYILRKYKPKYFVLENVRNLINHKSGNRKSLDIIKENLRDAGYTFSYSVLSPHRLKKNVKPQLRERIFIYGIYNGDKKDLKTIKDNIESHFYKNSKLSYKDTNISEYLSGEVKSDYNVEGERKDVLSAWGKFVSYFRNNGIKIPTPIWLDEMLDVVDLEVLPNWKRNIVVKNKEFYSDHKDFIGDWVKANLNVLKVKSHRKLEWNAGVDINSIYDGLIQFRPSGIRVKRPDFFPTFVATNHKVVIGKELRYITPEEIKELYGFKELKLPENDNHAYKQLGNTISVDVAKVVIRQLIK